MLRTSDILDEKNQHLRAENIDVEFPLPKETKKLINDMLEHLYYSQIEEYSKKYDLRPGMGLAAPQLGINQRFFVTNPNITPSFNPSKAKQRILME